MTFSCLLFAVIAQMPASLSNNLEAQWRREYPAAAARLRQATLKLTASGCLTRRSLTGETITTAQISFHQDGANKALIRTDRLSNNRQKTVPSDVFSWTQDYAFRLMKPPGGTNYSIVGYTDPALWQNLDFTFQVLFDHYVNASFTVNNKPFIELLADPTFKLQDIEETDFKGSRVIKVEYSTEIMGRQQTGSVLFDPAQDMAIREYHINFVSQKTDSKGKHPVELSLSRQIDYRNVENSRSFPMHIKSETRYNVSGNFEQTDLTLSNVRFESTDTSVFKLSGYGLPDIPLRPQQSRYPNVAIVLIFISLVLIACASFALSRKLAKGARSDLPTMRIAK